MRIGLKGRYTIRTTTRLASGVLLVVASFVSLATAVLETSNVYAADHLVAHWKFDETDAGDNAKDEAGTNDGIPGGFESLPIPSTDVPPVLFDDPRSASFDGSSYYTISRPASTAFTICAWVKTSSMGGGGSHWESAPIMDSETGGVDYDFGFGVGNGGRLMFGNGGDDVSEGYLYDAQVNGETTINDDEWHNVCVTRNNTTGEVKLYVDAQLDGSGVTGIGPLTSNPYARIGFGYDGAALFEGLIDDVRVYSIDLTPEQIQKLADGANDPFDDDNDSVSTAMENGAPNEGDGNNDGTQDSEQPNVTSLSSPVDGKYVTLAVDDSCTLSDVSMVRESSYNAQDGAYQYAGGLLNFTATGCDDDQAHVALYYNGVSPDGLTARKYNPVTHSYFAVTSATITQLSAPLSGTMVSYTITDNDNLDTDDTVGTIVDPVGLASLVPDVPNTGVAPLESVVKPIIFSAMITSFIVTILCLGAYRLAKK